MQIATDIYVKMIVRYFTCNGITAAIFHYLFSFGKPMLKLPTNYERKRKEKWILRS